MSWIECESDRYELQRQKRQRGIPVGLFFYFLLHQNIQKTAHCGLLMKAKKYRIFAKKYFKPEIRLPV